MKFLMVLSVLFTGCAHKPAPTEAVSKCIKNLNGVDNRKMRREICERSSV